MNPCLAVVPCRSASQIVVLLTALPSAQGRLARRPQARLRVPGRAPCPSGRHPSAASTLSDSSPARGWRRSALRMSGVRCWPRHDASWSYSRGPGRGSGIVLSPSMTIAALCLLARGRGSGLRGGLSSNAWMLSGGIIRSNMPRRCCGPCFTHAALERVVDGLVLSRDRIAQRLLQRPVLPDPVPSMLLGSSSCAQMIWPLAATRLRAFQRLRFDVTMPSVFSAVHGSFGSGSPSGAGAACAAASKRRV